MFRPMTESRLAAAGKSTLASQWTHFPTWVLAAFLALATMALYWPVTHHEFIGFDDDVYVTANFHVRNGLTAESIPWAFSNPVSSNWHPLTVLSHMLDCQIYGVRPWGHHFTNLWLHALDSVLLFLLLCRLTGARWRSAVVAALFAWHPLHVESVAWVAERKDVLSTCFGLLALLAYAEYVEKGEGRSDSEYPKAIGEQGLASVLRPPPSILHPLSSSAYWLSLFCFALGLLSKPMLVTWPFLLLLLDYWPLKRFVIYPSSLPSGATSALRPPLLWRLLVEKFPFFALSAVVSVVTYLVQERTGAMRALGIVPLGMRCENAVISYCRYLAKLLWPVDLAVVYPYPTYWPPVLVFLAGLLLVGLTVFFWRHRRRYPFCLMGWSWFIGTLVPVIGLVQVGIQAMADRYTYIPSVGLLILVVWGGHEMSRHWRRQASVLSWAGAAACILYAAAARHQLEYWQDGETLFRHALKVTADNCLARNNLGVALSEKNQNDAAMSQFQTALRLNPDYAEGHYNLGNALAQAGETDAAIGQFQTAIRRQADFAKARNNLGNLLAKQGRTNEAIAEFQAALRCNPDYADAHFNLGNAFLKRGQLDEAASQYQAVTRLWPDFAPAHFHLGTLLAKKGQADEAIIQFQAALRLKPDDAVAHDKLGIVLGDHGRLAEAIRQFQEALRLKPDYAEASNNLLRASGIISAP